MAPLDRDPGDTPGQDPGDGGGEDAVVERFEPTSGRLTGILGLVLAAVVAVLAFAGGAHRHSITICLLAVLGGVLVWVAMLRPGLWVSRRELGLRGMFHTDRVPLAAIDRVVVTQVLAVTAGGKRYVCPAVGYSARQTVRARRSKVGEETALTQPITANPQLFVETRIRDLAQEARERAGIRPGSPEQAALAATATRTWAWPWLGAVAVLAVATLLWILV